MSNLPSLSLECVSLRNVLGVMNAAWTGAGGPPKLQDSPACAGLQAWKLQEGSSSMALLWQGATERSWDHRNMFHFGNLLIQTQKQTNKKVLPSQAGRNVGSNYLLGRFGCNSPLGKPVKLSNWMQPILKDLKKWLICRKENQMSEKMRTAGIGTEKPWNRIGYQIPFAGSF